MTVDVPAASTMLVGAMAIVTVGAGSSSVIVTVSRCVPDSVPLVTLLMSTMMVSLVSSSVSCTAVSVTEPLVLPARITICAPERL